MKVEVFDRERRNFGSVDLNDQVWGKEFLPRLVSLYYRYLTFLTRKTISKTKTKGEVSGGGRKPWAQKGTGRARQGSIRSPQWRGGGVVFGPTGDQNYQLTMNKKERKTAFCSLLSKKNADEKVTFIDSLSFDGFKTKLASDFITNIFPSTKTKRTLVVVGNEEFTKELTLSFSNLPKTSLTIGSKVNFFEVFNASLIIMTKKAVSEIENRLSEDE